MRTSVASSAADAIDEQRHLAGAGAGLDEQRRSRTHGAVALAAIDQIEDLGIGVHASSSTGSSGGAA
jgi:hypothetical protein